MDFDLFKGQMSHELNRKGDIYFLWHTLENEEIEYYYENDMVLESLYLLRMVDYLCRVNELPKSDKYNNLRNLKLSKPLFPSGVELECLLYENEESKREYLENAIPEFLRFNIVEASIRNAC